MRLFPKSHDYLAIGKLAREATRAWNHFERKARASFSPRPLRAGGRPAILPRSMSRIATLAVTALALASCKPAPVAESNSQAAPDPVVEAQAAPLTQIVEKALKAYNDGDASAFFADFATTATPPPTAKTFATLYAGYYQSAFGKITALHLNPRETSADPDFAMIVYDAKFGKKTGKVSANFIRENGAPKLVQIRIE
jgi:hypothetical protein